MAKKPKIKKGRGKPPTLYPFLELKVGEWFQVKDLSKENSLRVLASRKGTEHDKVFTVRRTNGAIRVYREA